MFSRRAIGILKVAALPALCALSMMWLVPRDSAGAANNSSDLERLLAPLATPPGIGRSIADGGAVFTDEKGMTLYAFSGPGLCSREQRALDDNLHPLLKVYSKHHVPDCADRWPPLLASADSKPVGDWTLISWPEGGKQWAYKGEPLHRSYKDQLPRDMNGVTGRERGNEGEIGTFGVAYAPLQLPTGIKTNFRMAVGVVAVTDHGPLYTLSGSPRGASKKVSSSCADCSGKDRWKPVLAGEMMRDIGPWTVVKLNDGSKAWSYRGKTLYTYAFDQESSNAKGLGVDERAELVVLQAVPMAPVGMTVRRTLFGPAYADAGGMTAYNFVCSIKTPPGQVGTFRFACDAGTDDLAYRELFCPAPNRCAEMWKPIEAPANAQPQGGTWSVAVIPDPKYPLRWIQAKPGEKLPSGASKVWTYRGRPLFTSLLDDAPGDIWGDIRNGVAGERWLVALAGENEEGGIAAGD